MDLAVEFVKSTHFIVFMQKNVNEILGSREGIGNGKSAQSKATDNAHNTTARERATHHC